MNILISIVWILFSILMSVNPVKGTKKCGLAASSPKVNSSLIYPSMAIMTPPDDTGSCLTFVAVGKVTITSPLTTSPLTKYLAGSSFNVSWVYTPNFPLTTTVSLTCASPGTGKSSKSSSLSPASLTIDIASYGSNCTLSLSSISVLFRFEGPVYLTVSQQLSFSSPISGNSYPLSTGSISVKLITGPSTFITTLVAVVLRCGSSSSTTSVTTNSPTDYPIPSGYSGACTLTPVLTSPDQDYLVVPPSTMSFFLKYNLTFSLITLSPVAGGAFSFQMDTDPSGIVSDTVAVSLICGGVSNQIWTMVAVNTLFSTTLNSDVTTGVNCFLQTAATSEYFYQTISSSFIINANIITVTSPAIDDEIASGSDFIVAWTTSTTFPGTIYNVSLACPEFSTLTSNTTSLDTAISIPNTYYGVSCAVTVAATGFTTAQISVVVTQILSFETPTTGSVIALNTTSIPLKLITSGANIYADVTVSFQCDGGPATTSDFAANTDTLTQSVSPSQIGSCNLTITSAPNYLLYPSNSASFTLQYKLIFVTLPTTLYLNQSFTIQINTKTPASAPPPITLFLICPTEVVSDTWTDVLINQPNSLILSSTTPLDSCFFKVYGPIS